MNGGWPAQPSSTVTPPYSPELFSGDWTGPPIATPRPPSAAVVLRAGTAPLGRAPRSQVLARPPPPPSPAPPPRHLAPWWLGGARDWDQPARAQVRRPLYRPAPAAPGITTRAGHTTRRRKVCRHRRAAAERAALCRPAAARGGKGVRAGRQVGRARRVAGPKDGRMHGAAGGDALPVLSWCGPTGCAASGMGGEDAALVNYHHYEQCNERLSC